MERKLLKLLFIFINIIQVFCDDCELLFKFLQSCSYSISSIKTDCCGSEDYYDKLDYTVQCNNNGYITSLDLKFGKNTSIEVSRLSAFEKLTSLTIESNNFANYMLSDSFFKIPNLKRLEVVGVNNVPESITENSSIEEIYLDNNKFVKFPYILKKLKKLRVLSMNANNLSGSLTDEIRNFPALEELYLRENSFEGELKIPSTLKVLDIEDNSFSSYSEKNTNKVLQDINCKNNDVDNKFLEKLTSIRTIRKLDLSNTQITRLPNAIFDLDYMEKLYLAGNSQLKARIVKFGSKSGNHKVSDCVLTDVNVACYQKDTCLNDAGYLKKYRECTNYEVDDTKFNINTYIQNFCRSENCYKLTTFLADNKYKVEELEDEYCISDTDNDINYDIECKNDFITSMDLTFKKDYSIDFSKFPVFENLVNLTIDDAVFKDYTLSDKFFDLPNLKKLEVTSVSNVPSSVNASCPVEEINLNNNKLSSFPYSLKDLKKLTTLFLNSNKISGELTEEIKDFSALKELYLNKNEIKGDIIIPDNLRKLYINNNPVTGFYANNTNKVLEKLSCSGSSVGNEFLSEVAKIESLKNLDVSSTKITKLPGALFTSNIDDLNISDNSQLKARIINFRYEKDTSPLSYCNFENIKVLCYQNNTCKEEKEYVKKYKECTEKEINMTRYDSSALSALKLSRINYAAIPLIVFVVFSLF